MSKAIDIELVRSLHYRGCGERTIATLMGISRWVVREVLAGTHWQIRDGVASAVPFDDAFTVEKKGRVFIRVTSQQS